jgi:RNA polymerase sigma-70 factor (ECF subfamily)
VIANAAGLGTGRIQQPSSESVIQAAPMAAYRGPRPSPPEPDRLSAGEAVAKQVAAFHAASFSWSLTCCGGRAAEAEDVLQIVYCKILEGRARFAGRAKLKTWLFAVIRRTAADQIRRRVLRRLLLEGRWRREPPTVADDSTPETEMLQGDRVAWVRRTLAVLSPRQRQMLELVFYHDHTVREAAEVLGLRIGTARVHYQRGKKMLARRFEEEACGASP